jgi:CRP/FNR family transcriptional regulator, cyclic AMP receptor protein
MDESRLEALPLFAGLSRRELGFVARLTDEVDVRDGEELIHAGGFAYEFFVIVEGAARVVRDGAQIATLGPGDFMGEIGVLEGTTRNASVFATSAMRVAVMSAGALRDVRREVPHVAERIERAVAERTRQIVA